MKRLIFTFALIALTVTGSVQSSDAIAAVGDAAGDVIEHTGNAVNKLKSFGRGTKRLLGKAFRSLKPAGKAVGNAAEKVVSSSTVQDAAFIGAVGVAGGTAQYHKGGTHHTPMVTEHMTLQEKMAIEKKMTKYQFLLYLQKTGQL